MFHKGIVSLLGLFFSEYIVMIYSEVSGNSRDHTQNFLFVSYELKHFILGATVILRVAILMFKAYLHTLCETILPLELGSLE